MTDDANTKTHHQNIQSHIVNPSDVIYTRFEVKKMTLSETLTSVYENRNLIKAVFSSRRKKSEECRKVTVKPLLIKGEYIYQAEYYVVYSETVSGLSKGKKERAELYRLMADAEKGLIKRVYIKSRDRLARDFVFERETAEKLNNWGVELIEVG